MTKGLFDENDDQSTLIEKANDALSLSVGGNVEEDVYTEEELKIAEEALFNGFVTREYSHDTFKSFKIKISTLRPFEFDFIDSALMKFVEMRKSEDGSAYVSDIILSSKRSIYALAFALVSVNGEEIDPDIAKRHKNLKAASERYERLVSEGKIKESKEHLENVLDMIISRAATISV
jgi:hypothetical protein